MTGRIRLGMLTPSSNTVLEPVTAQMLAGLPDLTAHFSRFRVTQIGLSSDALGQFSTETMVAAADLLADARVGSIVWNGTSAAWLGFEADERLCAAISDRTGIPASTSVLAYRDLFVARGIERVGLVTPYTDDVQERIRANWGAAGFACGAERNLGLAENFAFAAVDQDTIAAAVRGVAAEDVQAVVILCTNLAGAEVASALEGELGIPILDSVAVSLWKGLSLAGGDPASLARWGSVFAEDGDGRTARHASCVPARVAGSTI